MILTVKCPCTAETSVDTDDVGIEGYLSELEFDGWVFPNGTIEAYSLSDAELAGMCPDHSIQSARG